MAHKNKALNIEDKKV